MAPVFRPERPSDDLRLAAANRNKKEAQDVLHGAASGGSPTSQTRQQPGGGRFTETVDPTTNQAANGLNYDDLVDRLQKAGLSPADIGRALHAMRTGEGIPAPFARVANELGLFRTLMFNVEVQRDPRNMIFSAMAQDAMLQGTNPKELLSRPHGAGQHPATPTNAAIGFEHDHKQVSDAKKKFLGRGDETRGAEVVTEARGENRRRQITMLKHWFQGQLAAGEPVARDLESLKKLVYDWVERYYQLHPPEA